MCRVSDTEHTDIMPCRQPSRIVNRMLMLMMMLIAILVPNAAFASDWHFGVDFDSLVWESVQCTNGATVQVTPDRQYIKGTFSNVWRDGTPYGVLGATFTMKLGDSYFYFWCISPNNAAPRQGMSVSFIGKLYSTNGNTRRYHIYTRQTGDINWPEWYSIYNQYGIALYTYSQQLEGYINLQLLEHGQLKIEKKVAGSPAGNPANRDFKFNITVKNINGAGISGNYAYTGTGGKGNGNLSFSGGKATVTLKAGQSITLQKMPAGGSYAVTEDTSAGFDTKFSSANGKIKSNATVTATATNTWNPRGEWVVPDIQKTVIGQEEMLSGDFTFELHEGNENGTILQTAKVAAARGTNGRVSTRLSFDSLKYDKDDIGKTYTYTVVEKYEGKPGYTYDRHVVRYEVSVALNEAEGKLVTTATRTGSTTWTNTYEAHGSGTLAVEKTLNDRKLQSDEFTFELREGSATGTVISTARNDANGHIEFPSIDYDQTQVGVHHYFVTEVVGTDNDVIYDLGTVAIDMNVEDNRDGTLSCKWGVVSPKKYFENNLKKGNLTVNKIGTSTTEASRQKTFDFSVTLTDKYGNALEKSYEYRSVENTNGDAHNGYVRNGSTITLNCDEKIEILDLPASSIYSFTEAPRDGYTLITADSDLDGTVAAESTVAAVAVNDYESHGEGAVDGWKIFPGHTIDDGEFEFQFYTDAACTEEYGEPVTNDASGKFSNIYSFDEQLDGQTIYLYAKELPGTDPTIEYNTDTVVCFRIIPRDQGDGTMLADITAVDPVTKEPADPYIGNSPAPGDLKISKTVNTPSNSDQEFVFRVGLRNDNGYAIDTETIADNATIAQNVPVLKLASPMKAKAVAVSSVESESMDLNEVSELLDIAAETETDTATDPTNDASGGETAEEKTDEQTAIVKEPLDNANSAIAEQKPELMSSDDESSANADGTTIAQEPMGVLETNDGHLDADVALSDDNNPVNMPQRFETTNLALNDAIGVAANAGTATVTAPTYTISVWNATVPLNSTWKSSGFTTSAVATAGNTASVTTRYNNNGNRVRPYAAAVNVNMGTFTGTVQARINYNTKYGSHNQYGSWKTVTNTTAVTEGHTLDWWYDGGGTGSNTYYIGYNNKTATIDFQLTGEMNTFFTATGTVPGSVYTSGTSGNITSTMKLTPKEWKITYNLNGGSISGQKTKYTGLDRFTLPTPTRTGYTFSGWTGTNGTTPRTSVTIGYKDSGDRTYTANWTANTYQISYNLNGGAHGSSHPASGTYNSTFTVSNPTKVGYNFAGWNISGMDTSSHTIGSSTTTNQTYGPTTATSYKNLRTTSGTVTFTATWTPASYKVRFNANGGSGSMADQTIQIGTNTQLNARQFYRFNHRFVGWNTKADGSGTSYSDRQSVLNLSNDPSTPFNLYAQWQPIDNAYIEDGYLYVVVPANATVTLPGITGGTEYTVEELTPSGWRIVDGTEKNMSGVIPAADTVTASVENTTSTDSWSVNKKIVAKKTVDNVPAEAGLYQFQLMDSNHSVLQTKTNGNGGIVDFDSIRYTANGTYTYYIKESVGSDADIIYDEREYRAVVTVSGSGTNHTAAVAYYVGSEAVDGIVFENKHQPGKIRLTKTTVAPDYFTGTETFEFNVSVNDAQGRFLWEHSYSIEVGMNASETIEIGDIPVGAHYTVRELSNGAASSWQCTSGENVDGIIDAPGEVDDIEFVNTNVNSPDTFASVSFEVSKTLENRQILPGEFAFELLNTDETPALDQLGDEITAVNQEDGTVEFSGLFFDEPGTYHYVIREIDSGDPTVTYDHAPKNVEITVRAVDNKLIADEPIITGGTGATLAEADTFANVAKPAKIKIMKNVATGSPTNYTFTFRVDLEPPADSTMTAFETSAGGTIQSGSTITLAAGGSLEITVPHGTKYTVTELGVSTDPTAMGWVTSQDSYTGTASWNSESLVAFTNEYNAKGVWTPTATKTVSGLALAAGDYTFELVDASGTIIDTATNDADGAIAFTPITYTLADVGNTYTYVMRERTGANQDIAYDPTQIAFQVRLADRGNGTLDLDVKSTMPTPRFVNTHKRGNLSITKTAIGTFPASSTKTFPFTIRLYTVDEEGVETPIDGSFPMSGAHSGQLTFTDGIASTSLASGQTVTISNIPSGTYYSVDEGNVVGFNLVDVTDGGGTIAPDDTVAAVFTNEYEASGSIDLNVSKTVIDNEGAPVDIPAYGFAYVLDDGTTKHYARNDALGRVVFEKLYYTEPGTYTYTIHEVQPNTEEAEEADTQEHELLENRELTVEWANPSADHSAVQAAAGVSSSATAGETYLALTTRDGQNGNLDLWNAYQSQFTLTESEPVTVEYPSVNDAAGIYQFDTHTYTVTVNVVDNGDGTLTATPTYPSGGSVVCFENKLIPGKLHISKTLVDATSVSSSQEFEFTVSLKDASGISLAGSYTYTGSKSGTISDGGKITLTGGQDVTIEGLPVDARYTVSEAAVAGFTPNSASMNGTIAANTTSEAAFVNTYRATGSFTPETLTKKLENGVIKEGYFTFELYRGESATGTPIATATNAADGTVSFDTIQYTQADAGQTYNYIIKEKNDGKTFIDYDNHTVVYSVSVVDNGNGTLKITPTRVSPEGALTFKNAANVVISTLAKDKADGDKNLSAGPATITDTVSYSGLVEGIEYTMTATVHIKGNGDTDEDSVNGATGSTTFTADQSSGTVSVDIPIDTTKLVGKTIVVFETCTSEVPSSGGRTETVTIAEHESITDTDQTVTVVTPSISTTAIDAEDGDKNIAYGPNVKITDTVRYENLSVGTVHIMEGELHAVDEHGTDLGAIPNTRVSKEFTPTSANGSVEMDLAFDSRDYPGDSIVVFEYCYVKKQSGVSEKTLVASHEDLDDTNQTVTVEQLIVTGIGDGDRSGVIVLIAAAAVSAAIVPLASRVLWRKNEA